MPVVYGKLYMKDTSGNIVQILPDANSNITDYRGATDSTAGISGLVPAALPSQKDMCLKGDGTWSDVSIDEANIVHISGNETITGEKTFTNVWNTAIALNGSSGEIYITGDASVYTISISTHTNIYFPSIPSGKSKVFTIVMNYNKSSSYAVYWPATTYWTNGTPPELNPTNVITFLGVNDGNSTRWFGTVSLLNASPAAS